VRQGVVEDIPLTGNRGIDHDDACDRINDTVIEEVDPSRSGDPVQLCVEDQQGDHAQPENRNRVPEQSDNADEMIDQGSLANGRQHTGRDTDDHAGDCCNGRQFQRCREEALDVLEHRLPGHDRTSEIAAQDISQKDQVLLPDRLVEAELQIHGIIDFLRSPVADDSDNGVVGHDATDDEGDCGQTDEGQEQHDNAATDLFCHAQIRLEIHRGALHCGTVAH